MEAHTSFDSSSSETEVEFKPFLQLPTEIRISIWKLALLPRIVDVCIARHHSQRWKKRLPFATHSGPLFTGPGSRLALAEVCGESRSVAYECGVIKLPGHNIAKTKTGIFSLGKPVEKGIVHEGFLDPSNDVLLLKSHKGFEDCPFGEIHEGSTNSHLAAFVRRLDQSQMNRIRHLAFSMEFALEIIPVVGQCLAAFADLDQLTLFCPSKSTTNRPISVSIYLVSHYLRDLATELKWKMPNVKFVRGFADLERGLEGESQDILQELEVKRILSLDNTPQ